MSVAVASAGGWNISTRVRGEVLTAGAKSPGCEFLVLGVPGNYSVPEIESWLGEILGVASDTSRGDIRPRPIPALLHHALTGLLFSHSEVWNAATERAPCSLAFVRSGGEVAFGWVGEIKPRVRIDGRPVDLAWLRVRDEEGREAFGFGVDIVHHVQVSLEWMVNPAAPDSSGVMVEAEWPGTERLIARGEPKVSVLAAPAASPEAPAAGPLPALGVAPVPPADVFADREPAPARREEPPAPATEPREVAPPVKAERAPEPQRPRLSLMPKRPRPEPLPPVGETAGQAGKKPPQLVSTSPRAAAPEPLEIETPERGAGIPPSSDLPLSEIDPLAPEPPEWTEHAVPPAPEAATKAAAESVARELAERLEPVGRGVEAPAAFERPRLRPTWPSERDIERARPRGRSPWPWVAAAALVAVAGAWLLSHRPVAERGAPPPLVPDLLHLFGARFDVVLSSRPPGAWVSVDGKDVARRTPATLVLAPGEHQVTLAFPDLGSASFAVRGERGEHLALEAPLWGSLVVQTSDPSTPIAVELDGSRVGFAPLTIDSLAPGAHEVRFTGPSMSPWGEALRVRVGERTEVIAHPMMSPATGVLEVRATLTEDTGASVLSGAPVWVDGVRRGETPLVLELPRGPHSVRVAYRGEEAPIQVIDLPGGNERFATFELGLNLDHPKLVPVAPLSALSPRQPSVIAATLQGVSTTDVREMWLYVREPLGSWRRYQMVMLKAPTGVIGVAVFPTALLDASGRTRYYMSALTQTGDEYFTEILSAQSAGSAQSPAPRAEPIPTP